MPKINFNVPFVNETGEVVQQVKFDNKKLKVNQQGQASATMVLDTEGNAVQEPVLIKDMLVRILSTNFEGDEKLPFGDRVRRGKLARKIATSSSASYRNEDLATIQELSAKIGSTALLAQLSDLIDGPDDVVDPPEAESSEKAA